MFLEGSWGEMGVPAVVTYDKGSQFASQWWDTLCNRLGVRVTYSQAHRPQANGRAEVAGKTLIGLLRKIWNEHQINWVEALPLVLKQYHDAPGESGYSPYEVVFGRHRTPHPLTSTDAIPSVAA